MATASQAYATGKSSYVIRSVFEYLAVGDDTNNDFDGFQNALNSTANYIVCPTATYRLDIDTSKTDKGLVVPDDTILDLQGSTLNLHCTGDCYGVRLKNRSFIINGTVNVVTVSGSGTQTIWQCPISVGPAYGDGGTVASPSSFEGVEGWGIHNIVASTDKDGAVGIQVIGGANHGVISHVEIPDSSVMNGGIHLDWGSVGSIDMTDITATRTLFDAGSAYTTHPHNIEISNIKIGNLSKASVTTGIRLSAVHDINVHDWEVAGTTQDGFYHTAGDAGYEFAQAAVKPFRHQNIRFARGNIKDAGTGRGGFCDMYADNVQAEIDGPGYTPLLDVIQESNIVFDQLSTHSDGGAGATHGFRFQRMIGGEARNCNAEGHLIGAIGEENLKRFKFEGGKYHNNRQEGLLVEHGTNLPEDVEIADVKAYLNGTDAGSGNKGGIRIGQSTRTTVRHSVVGAETETTQEYGIEVSTTAVDASLVDNHVEDVSGSGAAYQLAGSTNYGTVKMFNGNTTGSGVTTDVAGLNIVPFAVVQTPSGNVTKHFAAKASLTADTTPTAGTWATGDTIEYIDPAASGYAYTKCTSGGTPGTWKRGGILEA